MDFARISMVVLFLQQVSTFSFSKIKFPKEVFNAEDVTKEVFHKLVAWFWSQKNRLNVSNWYKNQLTIARIIKQYLCFADAYL